MDTLIEALLTLARLQGRPESIERESLDIVELLRMIVEDAQFEATIKGCRVKDALQAVVCDARLERFEAMTSALVTHKKHAGWFQSVSVLTGPNQNGTQSVKFQRVLKIIKHAQHGAGGPVAAGAATGVDHPGAHR